jgi:hypothetical protein
MARKKSQSFFGKTVAERNADVARFDAGVDLKDTAPLSAAQRARFERARKVTAAPAIDEDKARVLISLDPKLLAKAHARARRQGKTFSAFISELLQAAERRAG